MTANKKFTMSRGVKFNITNVKDKEVQDFFKFHHSCVKKINQWFWSHVKSGAIDIKKSSSRKLFINSLNESLTNCQAIKDNVLGLKDLFSNIGLDDCQKKYSRGILEYVWGRYQSFQKRNKSALKKQLCRINYINIKGKEVSLTNQIVRLDKENCILFLDIYLRKKTKKEEIKLRYDPNNSFLNHIEGLGSSKVKRFGGNICIKQGVFVACNKIKNTFSYSPVGYIGMDINLNNDNWISLSRKIKGKNILKKPDNIIKLESEINAINKSLRSRFRKGKKIVPVAQRPFKSSCARKLRLRVKKLHKSHKKEVIKFCKQNKILEFVVKNKLLIGIDLVRTGQRNGTFGQDKIFYFLIRECENRRIPFECPPTYNSSKTCSRCNHISKERHSVCSNCGCDTHADVNAAINTGKWAFKIFQELGHGASKYEKYAIIKKHFPVDNSFSDFKSKRNYPPEIGIEALKKKTKVNVSKVKTEKQNQLLLEFN